MEQQLIVMNNLTNLVDIWPLILLLSKGSSGGIRLPQMKSGSAVPSACTGRGSARKTGRGWNRGLLPAAPVPSTSPATDLGIGPVFFSHLIEPAASHEVKRNNAAALPKSNTPRKVNKHDRSDKCCANI